MHEAGQQEDSATAPWSLRRRWTVGTLGVVVVLALVAFLPGPIFRIIRTNAAHQLVDEVSTGRAELLVTQEELRDPIRELGTPVRSWTQISCWLSPRYSDGDGEQGVIVFYWQECALLAYEIYPLPADAADAATVAALLRGKTVGEPTCAEPIVGVLTPDDGASTSDEYATKLWWVDQEGEPPADQPERCALPTPDDPDTAHTEISIDEPLSADAYVVYRVRSPLSATNVGCIHTVSWLGSCTAEPEGFPVL